MNSTRVLIADSSPTMRECLCGLLEGRDDFEVVGTAKDSQGALEMAKRLMPDVVIIDAQIDGMGGVEATRLIKSAVPPVRVLFLSVFTRHIEASIDAGADLYLMKDCDPDELISRLIDIAGTSRPSTVSARAGESLDSITR